MKKLFSTLLILLSLLSYSQEKYQITIDLTQAKDDKLPVTLLVPKVTEKEIEYHMPKVVPGTYSISDFGRFVVDFWSIFCQSRLSFEHFVLSGFSFVIVKTTPSKITSFYEFTSKDFFTCLELSHVFMKRGHKILNETNHHKLHFSMKQAAVAW